MHRCKHWEWRTLTHFVCLMLCVQNRALHFQALVPADEVPTVAELFCKCANDCRCALALPSQPIYPMSVGVAAGAARFAREREAIALELGKPVWADRLLSMPYHVLTIPPKTSSSLPIETRLAVSTLPANVDGRLMGIFPQTTLPAIPNTADSSISARSDTYTFWSSSRLWIAPCAYHDL
jgi:hypothetical protein